MENFVELTVDACIDATIALDKEKRIRVWNHSAERIFGVAKDEAFMRTLESVVPFIKEDTEIQMALNNALKGFKSFLPASNVFSHRLRIEHHIIPLKSGEQAVVGILIIMHDVAHRLLIEERLKYLNEELEKRIRQVRENAREMSDLMAIMSNDVKEPLRHSYMGIETIIHTDANQLSNNSKATLRRTQAALNRISLQLDSLLAISELSTLEKPTLLIDVNEVLQEVLSKMEDKIKATSSVITTGEICSVKAHRNQLSLLITQLIDNAIKFNNSVVKKVDITCKVIKHKFEDTGSYKEGKFYKLTVKDNGIGFSAAENESIFHPFVKLNGKIYKGTGVGLSIVHKVMAEHDGFVDAESTEGEGSSFHCYFPV